MSGIDPNTLDPEEIRQIPIDRSKPYNGISEEQTRLIGLDPGEVETARLEHNAWVAANALEEDAALVVAAQQAVDDWEMTPAEAALGLAESGHARAHDVFVERWQQSEALEAALAAAEAAEWEIPNLDAESYVAALDARKAHERAQLEQERDETKRELEAAQLEALRDEVNAFVNSTPGAFELKPAIEAMLDEKLKQPGSALPSTDAERSALIASALNESVAIDATTEALRQQVELEWRIKRKAEGARDGLMTKADIDAAAAHYKRERFNQLAAAVEIDTDSFAPAPTAEEESAALVEKYRAKQEQSTTFHQSVAGIAARGVANAGGDRGEQASAEKRRYQDAKARAETAAAYGPDAQIKTGYGPNAVQEATDPHRALDEFGGAFPGYESV